MREASAKKVGDNEELTGLMRALGLQPGKRYLEQAAALRAIAAPDDRHGTHARAAGADLRYGRLMLMADQDTDGSHIKGLVISMIHHFWPELLRADYLQEFQTPLLKARRLTDGQVAAFFSIGEYEAWKAQLPEAELRKWRSKYYKGLGTSTAQEARDYFERLGKRRAHTRARARARTRGCSPQRPAAAPQPCNPHLYRHLTQASTACSSNGAGPPTMT